MPGKTYQQELLLSFNSSYLSKVYLDKCMTPGLCMDVEEIKEACWNGLPKEMLPEICKMNSLGRQMFIWGIRDYNATMEIDIGECLSNEDDYLCIDPYKSMSARINKFHS
jgi:hypothetical protein